MNNQPNFQTTELKVGERVYVLQLGNDDTVRASRAGYYFVVHSDDSGVVLNKSAKRGGEQFTLPHSFCQWAPRCAGVVTNSEELTMIVRCFGSLLTADEREFYSDAARDMVWAEFNK